MILLVTNEVNGANAVFKSIIDLKFHFFVTLIHEFSLYFCSNINDSCYCLLLVYIFIAMLSYLAYTSTFCWNLFYTL